MKLMASVTQEALYQGPQPPDRRIPLLQSLKTSSRMSSVRTKAKKDSHSTSGINGHWEGFVIRLGHISYTIRVSIKQNFSKSPKF